MALDRTIDVVVPHTLTQDKAFDRTVDWLSSQKDGAKPIKTVIDHENHTIQSISETRGKRITLNFTVSGNAVELHSEKIEGNLFEVILISGSVRFSESRIYSQLIEALKP